MARGSCPTATGQRPAADFPAAAGRDLILATSVAGGAWLLLVGFMTLAALLFDGGATRAQPRDRTQTSVSPVTVHGKMPVVIGDAAPAGGPCVAVDIPGRRAGQTECAARKLRDVARAAQAAATADPTLAVPNATSSDTTIGVGNVIASSQRLGGDLIGAKILPRRPPPPPPPTAGLPRRP
jgi:hypothetical protein